MHILISRGR